MSRQTDNGSGFLKDKLGGFQADPPPGVWENISSQLGGSRKRGMIVIFISAAASLALAVTLGIHYFGKDIPSEIEFSGDQETLYHKDPVEDEAAASFEEHVPALKSVTPASQSTGLEQKVVEAIAEAVTAPDDEEQYPIERSSPDISLATETAQENTGGGGELALALSGDSPESGDEMTEMAEIKKGGEEERLVAEPAAGDEATVDMILDAGDVGDVEMMEEIVKQRDKDPRWVLGAMLSPLYSYRDAESGALSGSSGEESGVISYATGVQVGYRATRRLAFESGIIYNKMGLSIGAPGIQVFAQDKLDYEWAAPEIESSPVTAITNSMGNIVAHSGEVYVNNYKLNAGAEYNRVDNAFSEVSNSEEGIRQHLDYLELPFNLRYTLLDKSFKIQLLGGVSTNLLVNNYVTAETASGTTEIGYLTNLRSVNYSGNAGVGFVYHFMKQLSLNVEPRFRYYLNSVNDATLPSTRPYTFGIYTGLNYFF